MTNIKYVICDVKKEIYYCTKPNAHWEQDITLATKFKTRTNANNVMKTLEGELIIKIYSKKTQAPIEDNEENNEVVNSLMEALGTIDFTKLMNDYNSQRQKYDLMQEDILHKIEFSEITDAYEAACLMKQLKEIRIKRREVKDKIEFLQIFTEKADPAMKKYFENLKTRTYEPRVLTNLFE
ncbi:MAG: hypothetical protein NC548_22720 [Lachnospiraceae bacterium]|nr:hypothetical protein [Lachnospiraceae bacterium]